MALFKILGGPKERISTDITPLHNGYAYFTQDAGGFYIDTETKRWKINETDALLLQEGIAADAKATGDKIRNLIWVGTQDEYATAIENNELNPNQIVIITDDEQFTEDGDEIATVVRLGKIKPDGETIIVDSETGVASVDFTAISLEDIGAATAAQGAKADSAVQEIHIGTDTYSGTSLNLPTSYPASDVEEWAKALSKPNYTYEEVGAASAAQGELADSAVQSVVMATDQDTELNINGTVIIPDQSTTIDATLTQQGAAADAKAVGDALHDFFNKLWIGTQAEFDLSANDISEDTIIIITDDEEETEEPNEG